MSIEVDLLYQMMRIRAVEEDISGRYSEQSMRCPTHLSVGQEAVASAAGLALNKNDYAVSTHRGHAHYLGKGGDLRAMLSEIYGKKTGCSRGRGGSMHLVDTSVGFMGTTAIVGNTIPIGVGLGLSCKLDKSKQISCIFIGDGAVEEGVFYESVNFAAVKKIPVLFICENNLYSVYSPLHVRQPVGRSIHKMVEAIGVSSNCGNGNDALESYSLISNSINSIKKGLGPQFLELYTYRWREHCGPNYDNDLSYRSEDEFLKWKDNDPIMTLYYDLIDRGIINSQDYENMKVKIGDEIRKAFKFAEDSPFPDSSEAYIDEYF